MNDYAHITVTQIDSISLIQKVQGEETRIRNRPCYGLSFCREGELCYTLNGKAYLSNRACALFLPQGQSYSIFCREPGTFSLVNFRCANHCLPDEFLVLPISEPESYEHDFNKMYKTIQSEPNCQFALMSLFYQTMHRLTQGSMSLVNVPEILHPGMNYLRDHLYDSELTNTALAEHAHISEVYFRRIFHQAFGMPPHQYILKKRIERSTELLKDPSLKIDEIAAICGFASMYNFYRMFKLHKGCTPNEYRVANQGYSD